jgi:hypothetical protein
MTEMTEWRACGERSRVVRFWAWSDAFVTVSQGKL